MSQRGSQIRIERQKVEKNEGYFSFRINILVVQEKTMYQEIFPYIFLLEILEQKKNMRFFKTIFARLSTGRLPY